MKRHFAALSAAVIVLLFFMALGEAAQTMQSQRKDESLRRGETRATVDPAVFSDPYVKKAYQIAREVPWVLDSIYCYCKCEESTVFRHKSLLSCYVDNHAAV